MLLKIVDTQIQLENNELEINFTFPLEHVTKLIVLGKRTSSVAVDKFGVVGKNIQNGCFSPTNNQPSPTTQVSVP